MAVWRDSVKTSHNQKNRAEFLSENSSKAPSSPSDAPHSVHR